MVTYTTIKEDNSRWDRDMNSVVGLVSVAVNPRHGKSSTPGCRTNCKDTGKARSIDQTQGSWLQAQLERQGPSSLLILQLSADKRHR